MVMMSHVAVSQVTGKETPASLTKLMVTDILREELKGPGAVRKTLKKYL